MNNVKIHPTAEVHPSASIGEGTKIWNWAQVRENSKIGKNCVISKSVQIDFEVSIGDNTKIQNNVSVFHGVTIEEGVFIGPHVCFTNDKNPRAISGDGSLKSADDWKLSKTLVKRGASIGANSTILPGITIGTFGLIGAGSVVTKDVPDYALVIGNPAKIVGYVCKCGNKIETECLKCNTIIQTNKTTTPNKTINVSQPYIGEEEKKAVLEVLNSGMLAQGPKVAQLEKEFATLCNTKYAIAVNSGTAALHAALYAAGIKEDDEVITVPFTFVASANSILMQSAKPIFVDIDPETYNIDIKKIESAITTKTKAILPVHLYGNPIDYLELKKIAEKYNLKIIEDACQAVLAEKNNVKAGNMGDLGAFSLYATKNMMSGEGGIVTTNNEEYAELVKRFRHHGQSEKTRYEYFDLGYNYRMTDMQAAIALCQIKRIEEWTKIRNNYADLYNKELSKVKGIITPKISPETIHAYHQYTIRITKEYPLSREDLIKKLKENNINVGIYYPKPLHLHPHFNKQGYKEGDFPVSEKISKEVVSLPVHPHLTENEIKKVIKIIVEV